MPRPKRNWRPFETAREFVRALNLPNQKAYEAWSKSGQRPDDIPGSPAKAYKPPQWDGWADYLGNGGGRPRRISTAGNYLPFPDARAYVQRLRLPTQHAYVEWAKTGDRPPGIPAGPYNIYGDEWVSWADWLGTHGPNGYLPFSEARAYTRNRQFRSRREWLDHAATSEFPQNIPMYPEHAYRETGWVDWPDWLGIQGKLTHPRILAILNSLKRVIGDLRPAELYAILQRRGVLKVDKRHTRIDALNALERLCQTDDIESGLQEAAVALDRSEDSQSEQISVSKDLHETSEPDSPEQELSPEAMEKATALPRLKNLDSLRVIDRATDEDLVDDDELIEFLMSSRIAALWQEVFDGNLEFTPEKLKAAPSSHYFDLIRERFLAEYDGAVNLALPAGYAFHKNGDLCPPNLMQRLTAFRLKTARRVINASGVGAGKTLSAINASQVVSSPLTVIIGVNATIANLNETVQAVFPDAVRLVKDRGPFSIDPQQRTYVILNYESFQQESWSDEMVAELLKHPIGCIVLDEIQSVRLRDGNEESNRRRRVRALVDGAVARNSDVCILGMSATPVMNDLHEAKTLLELVTGQDLSHLSTKPTVPNAILYHQQLTTHGLRYRPNYPQAIDTMTPVINGSPILSQLRRVQRRDVLGMEQAVLKAKLPFIQATVKPGTLIYTPFVTGIVELLVNAVNAAGLRPGVFTGDEKTGYEQFLAREVDVLIGSEPIGTGVDKLQEVGNRLIFASLPWTSAQYDQVVGRLHRQGARFDKVEVYIPIVELQQGPNVWSWDRRRLNRIQFKRTLADAAVDGVIPEGKLPSREEMQAHSLNALQEWISQVEQTAVPRSPSTIDEPDIFDILSGTEACLATES